MRILVALLVLSCGVMAWSAATTQPVKKTPAAAGKGGGADTEGMLRTLLAPRPEEPPLEPLPEYPKENAAGNTVAPTTQPAGRLLPEGTYIFDRVGRIEKTADGQQEFHFESDGQAMKDPPMLVLPSQNLMLMETAVKRATVHLKFRITGMVTEYGVRNHILIHKFVVLGPENPLRVPKGEENQTPEQRQRQTQRKY